MQGIEAPAPVRGPKLQIILAGIGGQGVVFASNVLSRMAMIRRLPVLSVENHGMAKRGGSVVTTLKIGGFNNPIIRRGSGDLLLGLTRDEALRNLPYLRPEGHCFVNSVEPPAVGIRSIDATELANRIGNPRAANLVLLGFAFAHPNLLLTADDLVAAVRDVVPPRILEANLRAVETGIEAARK